MAIRVSRGLAIINNNTFDNNRNSIQLEPATAAIYNNNFLNGRDSSIVLTHDSHATIESCSFQNNRAINSGGAINMADSSEIFVFNSYFAYNTAPTGGAIGSGFSQVHLTNCTFYRNEGSDVGGALVIHSSSMLNSTGCLFSENTGSSGGAIYSAISTISIRDSVFTNNEAAMGGALGFNAATGSILNSNISGNNALHFGGGLDAFRSEILLQQTHIVGNTANVGAALASETGNVTLLTSLVLNNVDTGHLYGAVKISGGEFSTYNSQFVNNSRAIICDEGGKTTIINGIFDNNYHISGRGSAIYCDNADNVTIEYSSFTNNNSSFAGAITYLNGKSLITISHSSLNNNFGSALFVQNSFASIFNLTCIGNLADDNTIIWLYPQNGGGCMDIIQSTALISSSAISGNSGPYGGGIFAVNSNISVNSTKIEQNNAYYDGGAIFIGASDVSSKYWHVVELSSIVNNFANGDGGGIFMKTNSNSTYICT